MSKGVIFSVHPDPANAIMQGEKEIEFRRQPPKSIGYPYAGLIYVTEAQRICGSVMIDQKLSAPVDNLIDETVHKVPSSREDLEDYFEGCEVGHGLNICDYSHFRVPLDRSDIESVIEQFTPPQNFQYVSGRSMGELIELGEER